MTLSDEERKDAMARVVEKFGDRTGFLIHQLQALSLSGQPCDICFYTRKPLLEVIVDPELTYALMYGVGPERLAQMLGSIKLRVKGQGVQTASINEIWVLNPMPKDGFSDEELQAVDLSRGDDEIGPNGETMRKMIQDVYHAETEDETERFLRRYLAS